MIHILNHACRSKAIKLLLIWSMMVVQLAMGVGRADAVVAPTVNLSSLSVNGFVLNPAFDPSVTSYKVKVPYGTPSVDVRATIMESGVKLSIAGVTIETFSNTYTYTESIVLDSDKKVIPIDVRSGDHSILKKYSVEVEVVSGKLSAGQDHSAVVHNGSVWTWGSNEYGQLGDSSALSTDADRTIPGRLPDLHGIIDIASAEYHTIALKADGTVWGWGDNDLGQLGVDRNVTTYNAPVQVPNMTNVIAVSAGDNYGLALKNDGTVWMWGYVPGQGYPDEVPILVGSGMNAIDGGRTHALMRKKDGTLWSTGSNYQGELGRDSSGNSVTAVQVELPPGTSIASFSAGSYYSLALDTNGQVWGWGRSGQHIGMNTSGPATRTPILVTTFSSIGAVSVEAGGERSFITKSDGTVWAIGASDLGHDGYSSSSAVQVLHLSDTKQLASSYWHTLARTGDGSLWAWGLDFNGELGNGSSGATSTPVKLHLYGYSDLADLQLSTGSLTPSFSPEIRSYTVTVPYRQTSIELKPTAAHSGVLSLTVNGAGASSGESQRVDLAVGVNPAQIEIQDRFGLSTVYDIAITRQAPNETSLLSLELQGLVLNPAFDPSVTEYEVRVPYEQEEALVTLVPEHTGTVLSAIGLSLEPDTPIAVELGDSDTVYPITLSNGSLSGTYTIRFKKITGALAAGAAHSAAVRNGDVWAWGANDYGQLGNGTSGSVPVATPAPLSLTGIVDLVAGTNHTAALKADGTVWSWGLNDNGQLGTGGAGYGYMQTAPVQTGADVAGFHSIVQVVARGAGAAALASDGTVWVWGSSVYANANEPKRLEGIDQVKAIAAGSDYLLMLKRDGTLWGIGANYYGMLGDGTTAPAEVPVAVALPQHVSIVSISAGLYHSLALDSSGQVWGWGRGDERMGTAVDDWNDASNVTSPVVVPALSGIGAVKVEATQQNSFLLKADGTVWGIGRNSSGELGAGDTAEHVTAVPMREAAHVSRIAAGSSHTLVMTHTGNVLGAGYNVSGVLGIGETTYEESTPKQALLYGAAELSGLRVEGYELEPQFASNTYSYSITVPFVQDELVVTPTMAHPLSATLELKGAVGSSSGGPISVPLQVGPNTLELAITAASGKVLTYTLTVNRLLGAEVAGLDIRSGNTSFTMNPAFRPDIFDYEVKVPDGVTSISLVPDADAMLELLVELEGGTNLPLASGEPITVPIAGTVTSLQVKANLPKEGLSTLYTLRLLSGTKELAAGSNHMLALQGGRVWTWGSSAYGQLGNGTMGYDVKRTVPAAIGLTDIVHVAAGGMHSLALKADGTVWTWGKNEYGELGNGRSGGSEAQTAPAQIGVGQPQFREITALAAGNNYSAALQNDGTVWYWGRLTINASQSSAPIRLTGIDEVKAIAAGHEHLLLLKRDGTLWTVGANEYGQLGIGTTVAAHAPVQVQLPNNTAVTSIAAAAAHSLALDQSGNVWGWGLYDERLGFAKPESAQEAEKQTQPVLLSSLSGKGAVRVEANEMNSYIAADDGSVWGIGVNGVGELGDGTYVSRVEPVKAMLPEPVRAFTAGGMSIAGMSMDGAMRASGYNDYGQLGDGTVISSPSPVITLLYQSADLSGLAVDVGELTPAFQFGQLGYELKVPSTVSSISITAIPAYGDILGLSIGGQSGSGGVPQQVPLEIGLNTVMVTVTGANQTVKSYVLTIHREASARLSSLQLEAAGAPIVYEPAFSLNDYEYTATVDPSVTEVELSFLPLDTGASAVIDGHPVSGSSSVLPLESGTNVVELVITGSDGITKQPYMLKIIRGLPSESKAQEWSRKLEYQGYALEGKAVKAVERPDGGYAALVVDEASFVPNSKIVWLDRNGEVETYTMLYKRLVDLIRVGDEYVVLSDDGWNGQSATMFKVNKASGLVAGTDRYYGSSYNGQDTVKVIPRSIRATTDSSGALNGYIVSSTMERQPGMQEAHVLKLSADGWKEWERAFVSPAGDTLDVTKAFQASDGGYFVAGTVNPDNPDSDMFALKLSSAGSEQWFTALGGSGAEWTRDVIETRSGAFRLIGRTSTGVTDGGTRIYTAEVGADGSKLWSRAWTDLGVASSGQSIAAVDGGYVVAATVNGQAYTFMTNEAGHRIWSSAISPLYNEETAVQVEPTLDQGWLLASTIDGSKGFRFIKFAGIDLSLSALTVGGQAIDLSDSVNVRTLAKPVESRHSYPNGKTQTWTVTEPGAAEIRVHFTKIQTEKDYDYLTTSAGDSWSTSDELTDIWSSWMTGDQISIQLKTDSSIDGYGFHIDKLEYKLPSTGDGRTITKVVTIPSEAQEIVLVPTMVDPTAGLLTIDGTPHTSAAPITIPVQTDEKTVTIATVGSHAALGYTYIVKLIKLSSDATLSQLSLSGVDLTFVPTQTLYEVKVPYEVGKLIVQADPNHNRALLTVEGGMYDPDTRALLLEPDKTTELIIRVTAQNGSVLAYTVRIHREASPLLTIPKEIEYIQEPSELIDRYGLGTVYSVTSDSDGGILLTGATSEEGRARIVKLTSSGEVEWISPFEDRYSYIHQLTVQTDGAYTAIGTTTVDWMEHLLYVELDRSGQVTKQALLPLEISLSLHQVLRTADQGYLIVLYEYGESNEHSRKIKLMKLSADGTMVWEEQVEDSEGDSIEDVVEAPDGAVYLLGTSSNGEMIWYRTWRESDESFSVVKKTFTSSLRLNGRAIAAAEDGVLLAGSIVSEAGTRKGMLLKVDENGTEQWRRIYESPYGLELHTLTPTYDGGFLVSGAEYELPDTEYGQLRMLKLDQDGNEYWKLGSGRYEGHVSPSKVVETVSGGYVVLNELTHSGYYFVMKLADEAVSLSALVPSTGELSPAFEPSILQYELNVDYAVNNLKLGAQSDSRLQPMTAEAYVPGTTEPIAVEVTGEGVIHIADLPVGETVLKLGIVRADGIARKSYTVHVTRAIQDEAAAVAEALQQLTWESIRGSNELIEAVVNDVQLPSSGAAGTKVEWSSSHPQYVSAVDGTVVRPAYTEADQAVVLTATVTLGAVSEQKSFTLNVVKLEMTDADRLAEAAAALVASAITADAGNVTGSKVTLPEAGLHGTVIAWSSSNPSVIGTDGTVVRPPHNGEDAVVTLTATLTLGGLSVVKSFTLNVVKLSMTDADRLAEAAAALVASAITADAGNVTGSKVTLPETGLHGAVIAWSSSNPSVIGTDGTVVRPPHTGEDAVVVLTATLTLGGLSVVKSFTLNVVKLSMTDANRLAAAAHALHASAITPDAGNVTSSKVTLPEAGLHGAVIAWSSSNPSVIGTDGTVVRPPHNGEDAVVVLTATLTLGGLSVVKSFTLNVVKLEMTDADRLTEAAAALVASAITADAGNVTGSKVTLPETGLHGAVIAWSSSNPSVIGTDGTVVRPPHHGADAVVVLTATITLGGLSVVKSFTLNVVKLSMTDADRLAEAAQALHESAITPDAGNVTGSKVTLPATALHGATIAWSSSAPSVIGTDGTVVRPPHTGADAVVILTATLTLGGLSVSKSFTLNVVKLSMTDADRLAEAAAALVASAITADAGNVTGSKVTLPEAGLHGTVIAWSSSNPSVIGTDGSVVRPPHNGEDAVVVLTATITLGGLSTSKSFTLTVVKLSMTDADRLAEAAQALHASAITPDAGNVTGSKVTLPETGLHGTVIAWSSSNPSVIGTDGTVVRPPHTGADAVVTLTATLTLGGLSTSKSFTLTVVKLSMTDADRLAEAAQALHASAITPDAGNVTGSKVTLPATALHGATIAWSSSAPSVIGTDGTVTRPPHTGKDAVVTLTATLTLGGLSTSKSFTLTVVKLPRPLSSDASIAVVRAGADVLFEDGQTVPTSWSYFTDGTEASLTIELADPNATMKLSSSVTDVTYAFSGAMGTLTVTNITYQEVRIIPLLVTAEDMTTKPYHIIVARLTLTDSEIVSRAVDSISEQSIRGQNASLSQVKSNLVLPGDGPNGTSISWMSSMPHIIETSPIAGKVVRQPNQNVTVSLTATVTKGVYAAAKTFQVNVLKLDAQESDEAQLLQVTPLQSGHKVLKVGPSFSVVLAQGAVSLDVALAVSDKAKIVSVEGAETLSQGYRLPAQNGIYRVIIQSESGKLMTHELQLIVPLAMQTPIAADTSKPMVYSGGIVLNLTSAFAGSASTVTAALVPVNGQREQGMNRAGAVVDITLSGVTIDPAKPVALTLPVTSVSDWAKVAVFYYNEATGEWEALKTERDSVNQQVTVHVTHFSTYGVFEADQAASPRLMLSEQSELILPVAPEGVSYYYTLDGSEPGRDSLKYSSAAKPTVGPADLVRVTAVKSGVQNSPIVSAASLGYIRQGSLQLTDVNQDGAVNRLDMIELLKLLPARIVLD
ncbi:immunoglobulin-like domain-containing protein [Paenibacillus sp. YYML68]|uniref:immunoglobulin-like domain-containing protein n=1 Tax=Paenibacillus sp. YYML68 TaxID=2909250 RepID=UPI0024938340|nr:immunoglobulin-like domain-containing protein [Paenibacillus sp. YYML68]